MELFLKSLRDNKNWRLIQKIVLIFYIVFLPTRFIFHIGFVNPVADFFLGFVTVLAPIVIFVFFPFRKVGTPVRITSIVVLILLILVSLLPLLFKFLAISDVLGTGQDSSLREESVQYVNPFMRETTYVSNCGATCSLEKFQVSELVLVNLIKLRIPGTSVNLPN